MNTNDPILIKELRRDEGVEYVPYADTLGIPTVGVGHNIKAKSIPPSWRYPLTDAQIDQLLAEDLEAVFSGLDKNICWWRNLSYARQRVLANMAFNMGIKGLMSFKNTLQAVQDGRWDDAAKGMMSSKWASQVKGRADRLAKMMREG